MTSSGALSSVRPVEELLLALHVERRLARLGMRDRRERGRDLVREPRVLARAARLAEIDQPAGSVAVRRGRAEVDVREGAILFGPGKRQPVERPGVAAARAGEPSVHLREKLEAAAAQLLQRAAAVAEVAGLLEPAVRVEDPVRRLHAVVGQDDRGRLLAEAAPGLLDELAAHAVDRLVDAHDLVPGRVVRGMRRVESVPGEVPREVRAHEVHAEQLQVGLELERQLADAGDLVHVREELVGEALEVLPPALLLRVVRGDEVGVLGEDPLPGLRRLDLRLERARRSR